MDKFHIEFYKWSDDYKKLNNSCKKFLQLNDIQFYFPILSLYLYYHNTKYSHKKIDLDRRYIVKEILEINYLKYYNSNSLIKAQILDQKTNTYVIEELFCKCIPILDPLHFIMNNYNNLVKRNPLLPSNYNYNTFGKINDMNNSAYIDTFFGYICSYITMNNLNPSFSIFYGSVNGISNKYHFDITDEYDELKNEKWFYKNLGKLFSIDMYVDSDSDYDSESDSVSESDESTKSKSKSESELLKYKSKTGSLKYKSKSESFKTKSRSSRSSRSSNSSYSDNSDYICLIKDIPVQCFFIEKLDGTLEDFLKKDVNKDFLLSGLFQITFALHYLQKKLNFTHNDLHINNVMYTKTEKTYLYYKFNNIYFKIPTFGYLFKMIDFGRSIFTFQNKMFFNDTFNQHGEAEGQYTYPIKHLLYTNGNKELILPNFNFDLCRLAITILDELCLEDNEENKELIDFIKSLTLDVNDEYLYKLEDDFNMYIEIAKKSNRAKPSNVIQYQIFNKFRVKKKNFPKKTYYSV